jgi:transposase InsO family protein
LEELYLTVKEVSDLLDVSERTVQMKAKSSRYLTKVIPGTGNGGKQYLISLSSLPQEAQERYKEQQKIPAPIDIFSEDVMRTYSIEQREKALQRFNILVMYKNSGKCGTAFVEQYNEKNANKISYRKLAYWNDKYDKDGIVGLIDKRNSHIAGTDSIPSEFWELFYALYMTPQKRSVQLCYDKTKKQFPDMKPPSYSTITRRVRQIPEYAILNFRGGKKHLSDKLPYMERDTSDLASNVCWVSDHHIADVFVKNARGKIVRPWITAFQDAKSRKIVAVLVRDSSPNATAIKQALRIGIEKYGIPDEIYTDNGKDYLSSQIDPESPDSILGILGIRVRRAMPYHGQSKPIERFFRTLEERFGKCFYSYIGNDGKKRPEHMQKLNKVLEKDPNIPSFDEYVTKLTNYIAEYNATPHSGKGMEGKSPDEVYYSSFVKPAQMISDETVVKLLFGNQKKVKVSNFGVTVCSIHFTSEDLLDYLNQTVIAKYDPNSLDKVYIYSSNGKFICQAIAKVMSSFRTATEEDFIRAEKQKKKAKKIINENKPVRIKNVSDILFENIADERRYKVTTEEAENTAITEAEKATSEQKKESFNPYSEMYDISKKKGVI